MEIPCMGEQDALFRFLDGLCEWAKIELERRGVQDLAFTIAATKSLIEFKETHQRDKAKRTEAVAKVREIRTSPPRKTNPSKTRGKARRTTHPRGTHASYALDLTGLLSVRRRESLPPLC